MPLLRISLTITRAALRAPRGKCLKNQWKTFSSSPPSTPQNTTTSSSPNQNNSVPLESEPPSPESGKDSSSSGARGPITYFSLALTGLVGASIVAYYSIEKEKRDDRVTSKEVVSTGKPALGGPWSLVDSNGIPRTSAQFHGKFSLLYFGFTHCPDICPSELVKVGKIIDTLGNDY